MSDLDNKIKLIFESNGYRIKESKMIYDEFRFFLTPPDVDNGDFEVFKLKNENLVIIAGGIVLGKSRLDKLNNNFELQNKLRQELEGLRDDVKLDLYEIEDDGNDYFIRMQCAIPVDVFSLYELANKINNFNESGNIVSKKISEIFTMI